MINSIVVDDEEAGRNSLCKLIDLYCPSVKVNGTAKNIEEAKELILEQHPRLIFLDVEMPGGSGFDLLESLDDIDFSVIFTTAHAAYAIKAIKYAAMDYLLKPINIEELKKAINKFEEETIQSPHIKQQIEVLSENRNNDQFNFKKIALPTTEGLEFFETKDIIRCEADRAYCKFFLADKRKLHISRPMSEYEDLLSQANFLKVHKSNIVNLHHVRKYIKGKGGMLVMTDSTMVDVAVRRKEDVMQALKVL